jgi:hypothetical protein
VRADVEVIMESLHGSDFLASGLVYDVDTGRIEIVLEPTALRTE